MKKILKVALITLLWLNGIAAVAGGIRMLLGLNYKFWFDDLLVPGILLFILVSITGMALSFFIRRHLLLLASGALLEGMCLVFSVTDQEEIFHHLGILFLLLGLDGLVLIFAAVFLLAFSIPTFKQPQGDLRL